MHQPNNKWQWITRFRKANTNLHAERR